MRKNAKLITLLVLAGMVLTGCGATALPFDENAARNYNIDTEWKDYTVAISSIIFPEAEKNITLAKGTEHEYTFTYEPTKALASQLTWVSSDEDVVQVVEPGKIKALTVGSAFITVYSTEEVEWTPVQLRVLVDVPIDSFSIEDNIVMDLDEIATINPTFVPFDTSYKELSYSFDPVDQDLITIEGTTIRSNSTKTGTVVVTATSIKRPELSDTFSVEVKTVPVTSVNLTTSKSRIEIGNETATLTPVVNPSDASAIRKGITYTVTEGADYVTVSDEGIVSSKKTGTATITATCGGVTSNPVTVEVFESEATAIHILNEDQVEISTLGLSNDSEEHQTAQLSVTYDTTEGIRPTNPNLTFTSENSQVATVSSTGLVTLVGNGSTVIKAIDTRYQVEASVTVTCTVVCKSIIISASKENLIVGETATITVSTVPATLTTDDLNMSIPMEFAQTVILEKNGKSATLTALQACEVPLTVTCNDVSTTKTFTFVEDTTFHDGTYYVVGNARFSTGTSIADPSGSWEDASKANIMADAPDPTVSLQRKSTIIFNQGDEWKLRCGQDYINIPERGTEEANRGEYVADKDNSVISWDDGKEMKIVRDNDGHLNIHVNITGSYDIFYKIYDMGTEQQWWSVYVRKTPDISLSKTTLNIDINKSETIYVNDYKQTYTISETYDKTLITVANVNNEITITTLGNYGTTTITVTDDVTKLTATCTITISKVFEEGFAYVVGSADYSEHTSKTGASWDDAGKALKMVTLVPDPKVSYQVKETITFNKDDLWKIRVGNDYREVTDTHGAYEGKDTGSMIDDVNMTIDTDAKGVKNIKVLKAGTYDIYYKIYNQGTGDEWWSVYVAKTPIFAINPEYVALDVGDTVTVTAVNFKDGITTPTYDNTVISVSVQGAELSITGLKYGATTVTITDGDGKIATCAVTVAEDFKVGVNYIVGSANFVNGKSDGGASTPSWRDVTKAFTFTKVVADPAYKKQYMATITFKAGDEWRVRTGGVDEVAWYPTSIYENYGLLKDGTMTFNGDNIHVNRDVKADIYFKEFNDGGYQCSVVAAAVLALDKTSVSMSMGDPAVKITASNAVGAVTFQVSGDAGVVSINPNGLTCSITAIGNGEVDVIATDEEGNRAVCHVKVSTVKDVTVRFTINYGTQTGQGVYLVGNFNSWSPNVNAIRGTWTEGNNWVFDITVPQGTAWEFKFIINYYDNPTDPAIRWEGGSNRNYTFNASGSQTFSWQE